MEILSFIERKNREKNENNKAIIDQTIRTIELNKFYMQQASTMYNHLSLKSLTIRGWCVAITSATSSYIAVADPNIAKGSMIGAIFVYYLLGFYDTTVSKKRIIFESVESKLFDYINGLHEQLAKKNYEYLQSNFGFYYRTLHRMYIENHFQIMNDKVRLRRTNNVILFFYGAQAIFLIILMNTR